ncbi:MAG: hypothetical protein RBS80_09435 [Thermoguttaceae bacterium]|jgi:hypothetical protein|nr:hypothetical protein [Thermoguttaceae bacterium]
MSDWQPRAELPNSLTQWVRDHARAVRGYVLGVVRHVHVADDLVQEPPRPDWSDDGSTWTRQVTSRAECGIFHFTCKHPAA